MKATPPSIPAAPWLSRASLALGLLVALIAPSVQAGVEDPPEIKAGERLFIDTRFAQYFFANSQGNLNATLAPGDAVMDTIITTGQPLPGPFAGQSMNCRACHLVDEFSDTPGVGNRTYADFARRSPVPARQDGQTVTPRNSPPLVSAARKANGHVLLHLDGQFSTMIDLVKTTLTGRNFGWMPEEHTTAIHHVARVIREDDGTGDLAQARSAGASYSVLFKGTSVNIFSKLRLPPKYRLDVKHATDEQIFHEVALLISLYVRSLAFVTDANGLFDASPYDVFLEKNSLPREPMRLRPGLKETDLAYSRRLRDSVNALTDPQYVTGADGDFGTHDQPFVFGPDELAGLKIFLAELPPGMATPPPVHIGNCLSCHAAPSFSDFKFHNTGVAQEEYDGIHGTGAFVALIIPSLEERRRDYNAFLPPTVRHPLATGIFKDVPTMANTGHTDLGAWNVLANPDFPAPQARLHQLLLLPHAKNTTSALLDRAMAAFKTPSLRDLGHDGPYLHNGSKDELEDVVAFYTSSSALVRANAMRNPDPRIGGISLDASDITPLAAFLRSLNEDYTD